MTVLGVVLPTPLATSTRSAIVDETPLTAEELASLQVATARDTLHAANESGGPLVVVPQTDTAQPTIEDILEPVVESISDQTIAAPIDLECDSPDTVVDALFTDSEAASAAVLVPTAPVIARQHLDTAAMRLRSSPIVVGPTGAGVPFLYSRQRGAAVSKPADGWTLPALTMRAEQPVDVLPMQPAVDSVHGLRDTLALIEANRGSARKLAAYTREWMDATGLTVTGTPNGPVLDRQSSD